MKTAFPQGRPVAVRLFDWAHGRAELSPATICDFGLDSPVHQAAIRETIINGATLEEIDRALGNGVKLEKLVAHYSPTFAGIGFRTSWDEMEGR